MSMEGPSRHDDGIGVGGPMMTWRRNRSSRGRVATTTTTTRTVNDSGTVVVKRGGGGGGDCAKSTHPSSAPPPDGPSSAPASSRTTTTTSKALPRDRQRMDVVDSHFPPPEICVVHSVELAGLNSASQFFDVFFADDAPYSMRDFQRKLGDVDVVHGRWEDCGGTDLRGGGGSTLPPGGESNTNDNDDKGGRRAALYSANEGDVEPLPPNSTRQRTMQFNTLTRSYFGPAYAKATKIQRATLLSDDRLLVIENVTHLSDIPYADRFRVVERWVLEVVEDGGGAEASVGKIMVADNDDDEKRRRLERSQSVGGGSKLLASGERAPLAGASCRLTIHAEVQMLKPCSWESQIRKKASETFTEVVMDWCKSATVALAATEEQMRKRLRITTPPGASQDQNIVLGGSGDSGPGRPPLSPSMPQPQPSPASLTMTGTSYTSMARVGSDLLAMHKHNFERIANGDLEWCSIEVMHSSPCRHGKDDNDDGKGKGLIASSPSFTTVLEYPSLNEYEIARPILGGVAGLDDDDMKMAGFTSQRKAAAVMMRKKRSKLFKKLSSRSRRANSKSANEQQQPPTG
ncbi:hypothetical protein ACHAW5_010582 [Stephanodiscus triporus]|uniref:VASt domain-containing protein n=1 Tax=Stephanodiscus triporus TaxID=2934178 RepID=A0ABD3QVM7_9STRA